VHKGSKRSEARKLRAAHLSLKAIAARLKIAKSTASLWLRDMPSAPAMARGRHGNKKLGNQSHQRSVEALSRWRREADQLWCSYRTEPLFMLGLGLYWGEGSKTTKSLRICNLQQ
jgi:transposase